MDVIKYIEDSSVEKFIKAANQIHNLDSSINIDYGKYISAYNKASKTLLPLVAKLKLADFTFLCTKFPNFDFTFEGRLKSEYSYFNKIIEESIGNKSANSDSNPRSLLYDTFAFRIVLNSVSYEINDSFFIANDKKNRKEYKFINSQDNDKHIYRINNGDIVQFFNGESVRITPDNIIDMNNKIYVISETGSYLPINGAKLVKTDRATLNKCIYNIQDALLQFYEESGNFEHIDDRDKDYVKHPKTVKYPISRLKHELSSSTPDMAIKKLKYNGINDRDDLKLSRGNPLPAYQSLHQTYYYKPFNIYFENQIRTIYMHNVAEYSPKFGHDVYKSNRIDENSLSKLPTFITYSKKMVRGRPEYSYDIHNMEYSVEKSFGVSLEDFYRQYQEIHNNIENEEPEI